MHIERYVRRNWAVYDADGELVVVAVYKKGAMEVVRRLTHREGVVEASNSVLLPRGTRKRPIANG